MLVVTLRNPCASRTGSALFNGELRPSITMHAWEQSMITSFADCRRWLSYRRQGFLGITLEFITITFSVPNVEGLFLPLATGSCLTNVWSSI